MIKNYTHDWLLLVAAYHASCAGRLHRGALASIACSPRAASASAYAKRRVQVPSTAYLARRAPDSSPEHGEWRSTTAARRGRTTSVQCTTANPRCRTSWGRLSFVYTNTPAWRSRHSPSANPFHDCDDQNQIRCSNARCGLWERELLPPPDRPGGAIYEIMGMFAWPFSPRGAEDLKGIQFYSRDTDHVGRAVHEDNEWLEIMRSDARPYFAEGERPTDCTDWNPGDPYRKQHCWSRLYPYAGGRYAPGCWARPAPGAPAGIWVVRMYGMRRASVVGDAAPISPTLTLARFRSVDQRGQDETRAVPRGRRPQCH